MKTTDEQQTQGKNLDEMSEAEAFQKMYAKIAGHWPEDPEERNRMLWSSPGIMPIVLAGAYRLGGWLTDEEAKEFGDLLMGLLRLLVLAHAGDEIAKAQFSAAKMLIFRSAYEVSLQTIEDVVSKFDPTSPLARGWELRQLMAQLSKLVVPAKPGNTDILKGPVCLSDDPAVKDSSLYRGTIYTMHPGGFMKASITYQNHKLYGQRFKVIEVLTNDHKPKIVLELPKGGRLTLPMIWTDYEESINGIDPVTVPLLNVESLLEILAVIEPVRAAIEIKEGEASKGNHLLDAR